MVKLQLLVIQPTTLVLVIIFSLKMTGILQIQQPLSAKTKQKYKSHFFQVGIRTDFRIFLKKRTYEKNNWLFLAANPEVKNKKPRFCHFDIIFIGINPAMKQNVYQMAPTLNLTYGQDAFLVILFCYSFAPLFCVQRIILT